MAYSEAKVLVLAATPERHNSHPTGFSGLREATMAPTVTSITTSAFWNQKSGMGALGYRRFRTTRTRLSTVSVTVTAHSDQANQAAVRWLTPPSARSCCPVAAVTTSPRRGTIPECDLPMGGHDAARCRPRNKNHKGVPIRPIIARTPPAPKKINCGHDIQGRKTPSPATTPPARVTAPKNSPSRATRGRRTSDRRNHRLINSSQRKRNIAAPTAIDAWTSNASTPNTRSGAPTTRTAIADRPTTRVIQARRRSGNNVLNASATGIINAVETE